MINSRDLNDLHPVVAEKARQFIEECKKEGIDILITSTYRDNAAQNNIYAQGRTRPGRIVTYARGGQSFHNYRLAFDFVPLVGGKPDWKDIELFKKCHDIGAKFGLHGLSFEMAHLQWDGGLTLAQLEAGKRPPEKATA